jgi:hypothetical protein
VYARTSTAIAHGRDPKYVKELTMPKGTEKKKTNNKPKVTVKEKKERKKLKSGK